MENAIKKIKDYCASQPSCVACRFGDGDGACSLCDNTPNNWPTKLSDYEKSLVRHFQQAGYTHISYDGSGVEFTGNKNLFNSLPFRIKVNISTLLGGDTDV